MHSVSSDLHNFQMKTDKSAKVCFFAKQDFRLENRKSLTKEDFRFRVSYLERVDCKFNVTIFLNTLMSSFTLFFLEIGFTFRLVSKYLVILIHLVLLFLLFHGATKFLDVLLHKFAIRRVRSNNFISNPVLHTKICQLWLYILQALRYSTHLMIHCYLQSGTKLNGTMPKISKFSYLIAIYISD